MLPDDAARLTKLLDWVRHNPALPHSINSLADHAGMSARTLQRQFQDAMGMTPIEWLTRERIGIARQLLENTNKPFSFISISAGFGSEESFRRHFRKVAGTSPSAYRKQFGVRKKL
jgi:AraC family transcriptional activator FtrA